MKLLRILAASAACAIIGTGPMAANGYHQPQQTGGYHQPQQPSGYHEHGHGHWHGDERHVHQTLQAQRVHVTISCFRGPWEEVIWDRPEPVFVDSLVAAGYSFPEAHAIAERVCRDIDGVGNPGHARSVMMQIFQDTPPHSTHNHLRN